MKPRLPKRVVAALFVCAGVLVAGGAAEAQMPVTPATQLHVSRHRGVSRTLTTTPSEVTFPAAPSTCTAPCTLALAPGRYRVQLDDVGADGHATLVARTVWLQPGDTHVRIRHRSGLRASAIASLAVGVVTTLVGLLLVAGSGDTCVGIGYGDCNVDLYAAGLLVLGAGVLGDASGGVLLGVSGPRVEVAQRARARVPSIAITPTAGGATAGMGWRF